MKRIYVYLILLLSLTSCKKLIYREVKCSDFSLSGEHYWFPLNTGDTVVFVNELTQIRKKYTIVDKQIIHTSKYTSDVGCGCSDISAMLLTSEEDSIWFKNNLRYVENQNGKYYEDIIFVIQHRQSGFYETAKTKLDSVVINSILFKDVEFFECQSCNDAWRVKKLYRVRNLGIIQFELGNGEIWTNANLTNFGITNKDSFSYSEKVCK